MSSTGLDLWKYLRRSWVEDSFFAQFHLSNSPPQFGGSIADLEQFLEISGIRFIEDWTQTDTNQAAAAFTKYIGTRRVKSAPKRPIADIMIGAFACRFDGLITRNPKDFKAIFPKLRIFVP